MSDAYIVAVEGLDELDNIEKLSDRIARFASMAVNRITRDRRASAAREIRQQVSFPARYLSGNSGRLSITRRANPRSLEAEITGRDRPTSLARFARNRNVKASRQRGGVSVGIKPGGATFMRGAFLMQLRSGNIGLAVRVKKGERLRGSVAAREIATGLYLLYGPSVNQVFRGVAEDGVAETAEALEREFLRLLRL